MKNFVHNWKPSIRKHGIYVLRIPETTVKHRKAKDLLEGRKVIALERLREYRGHHVYRVKLLSSSGYPDGFKTEFDMWGPYLCCSCPSISGGCRCGGY